MSSSRLLGTWLLLCCRGVGATAKAKRSGAASEDKDQRPRDVLPVARLRSYLALASSLAPIPCRDDFAAAAEAHFHKLGTAAEVGVFQGQFAGKNLKKWTGRYWAIDAWRHRPGDPWDKNFKDPAKNDANYEAARQATAHAGERVALVRNTSLEAAGFFPDGHFDWLYIDALHTRAALLDDLRAWWPKLRVGGLMSGDDYGEARAVEYMTPERYKADTRRSGASSASVAHTYNNWGVISATNTFAREVGAVLHMTWSRDCYAWPAWYMVKP